MKKKLLFEEAVSGAVLAIMVILAFINIVSRVIAGFSFAYTEELIVYLFVVTTMFSTASGAYRRIHMSLTIIADRFKGKGQYFFLITSSAASIFLFLLLLWQGVKMIRNQIAYNYLTAVMRMPQWIFTASLVIGSALFIFRTVQVTIQDWKRVSKATEVKTEAQTLPCVDPAASDEPSKGE